MREFEWSARQTLAQRRSANIRAHERLTCPTDDETWRLLLRTSRGLLSRYEQRIHPAYLEGFELLFAQAYRIPTVEELNAKLARFGWRTRPVDGYLPHHAYARLLAARTFPVAKHIRNIRDLEHSPIPDLAHDMIGHLPMLLDGEHRRFLQRMGEAMSRAKSDPRDHRLYMAQQRAGYLRQTVLHSPGMLRAADKAIADAEAELASRPSALARLSRLYLWTIEFGLLGEPEAWTVYGAALLSSGRELQHLMSDHSPVLPLSIEAIDAAISFCDPQHRYFIARDHAMIHGALDHVLELDG